MKSQAILDMKQIQKEATKTEMQQYFRIVIVIILFVDNDTSILY